MADRFSCAPVTIAESHSSDAMLCDKTWTILVQGPVSLMFFPPEFKFDRNFV